MDDSKEINENVAKRIRASRWNVDEKSQKINEQIYTMREQGYSYRYIAEVLSKQGYNYSQDKVGRICRKIYSELGKDIPNRGDTIQVDKNELYSLSKEGMSNTKIWQFLQNKGINIPFYKVNDMIRVIYKEKGEKRRTGRKSHKDIDDEDVYRLRKEGKSFHQIAEYYRKRGIDIDQSGIYKRVIRIFKEKGEDIPYFTYDGTKREIIIPEEVRQRIYSLRKSGVSIDGILQIMKEEDNINLTRYIIRKNLEDIYSKAGEVQPKAKPGRKKTRIVVDKPKIKDYYDDLFILREAGFATENIRVYLEEEYGFKCSESTIRDHLNKIYEIKGKKQPRASKAKRLIKPICNFRAQGLKYSEISKKIQEEYGVKISATTIKNICVSVFFNSSRKEIKENKIKDLKTLDDEFITTFKLWQQSEELLNEYKELQRQKEQRGRDE